jgi:hypothetical protein
MTAEIAPSGRSAVWVPYVVRRAERTFRKPVAPLVTDAAGRSSAAALLGLAQATSGDGQNRGIYCQRLHES